MRYVNRAGLTCVSSCQFVGVGLCNHGQVVPDLGSMDRTAWTIGAGIKTSRQDLLQRGLGSMSFERPAQPRPGVIGAPCAACPVRPLSICGALSLDELAHLERIVSQTSLGSGQILFQEGDPADHRFNVTEGCLRIYKLLPDGRRQIIGFLFAGDFLGLSITDSFAYSAEAVTSASLCRFRHGQLEDLLERFPLLEKRLLGLASDELAIAQEQMLLLGRKSAKEKLASMLLMLSARAERRIGVANPIDLPMTRNDIADYLGLTTETVSRVFTQFKTGSLIALEADHKVRLQDIDGLQDLAEGG